MSRVIVLGLGAIGGTLAAALAHSGAEVTGIARGAQLEAIRTDGLRLRTPETRFTARIDCVPHPSGIAFRPDDLIVLCVKTQHTEGALEDLRAAGVTDQPIFCFQNGVANERQALRRFGNVHGATVMLPASYVEPGAVDVWVGPKLGLFDIGRYPQGSNADDTRLADILNAAGFAAFVQDDVMASKYGKLLMNLMNIVEAALGHGADRGDLPGRVRAEAEAVLTAAGIAWRDVGAADPRREGLIRAGGIDGARRSGGSTTQSLLRGAGSIETDWLNGEIALLGRLHGHPAPLNARLCALSTELLRAGCAPGAMDLEALSGWLAAGGG